MIAIIAGRAIAQGPWQFAVMTTARKKGRLNEQAAQV